MEHLIREIINSIKAGKKSGYWEVTDNEEQATSLEYRTLKSGKVIFRIYDFDFYEGDCYAEEEIEPEKDDIEAKIRKAFKDFTDLYGNI